MNTIHTIVINRKCQSNIAGSVRALQEHGYKALAKLMASNLNLNPCKTMGKKDGSPQDHQTEPENGELQNETDSATDSFAESDAERIPGESRKPKATKWQRSEQYFHYDFNGDLVIDRDVLRAIPVEEVAEIVSEVYGKVKEQEGLKTDTLYFNNDEGYRLVVKDSHSREDLGNESLSRSGNWHRNNNHKTSVSIERA